MPAVPAQVWEHEEVRRALASWDMGTVSRLIRQLTGLRQEEVAIMTGLSQGYLSQLEAGKRRLTDIDKIVSLLDGLGPPDDLLPLPRQRPRASAAAAIPQGKENPGPILEAGEGWQAPIVATALRNAVRQGSEDRRTLLLVQGAALTAHAYHWMISEPGLAERPLAGRRVDATTVALLSEATHRLRLMDAEMGGGRLIDLGAAHLQLLTRLLERGRYDETTGQKLAAVAAETAMLTGWFLFDSGLHAAAQRYFLAGLRAAHTSGDARIGAGLLSFMAIQSYSAGNPQDAVELMQTARNQIRHMHTHELDAALLTRQARGHAKLGDQLACERCIDTAQDQLAQGRSDDDPAFVYWMSPGEILGQAGSCYLDLGQADRARDAFTRAQDTLNPQDVRTRALYAARAGIADIKNGDAASGCVSAAEAIDLAERVHSHRLDNQVRTFLNELMPHARQAGVSDFASRAAAALTNQHEAA